MLTADMFTLRPHGAKARLQLHFWRVSGEVHCIRHGLCGPFPVAQTPLSLQGQPGMTRLSDFQATHGLPSQRKQLQLANSMVLAISNYLNGTMPPPVSQPRQPCALNLGVAPLMAPHMADISEINPIRYVWPPVSQCRYHPSKIHPPDRFQQVSRRHICM